MLIFECLYQLMLSDSQADPGISISPSPHTHAVDRCASSLVEPLKCKHTKVDCAERCLPPVPPRPRPDLGDCGYKLSNGEEHAIGIVRALVRHPQVVVLDETTGKVDAEVWQAVSEIRLCHTGLIQRI